MPHALGTPQSQRLGGNMLNETGALFMQGPATSGSVLSGSVLSGSVLSGSVLSGSVLSGSKGELSDNNSPSLSRLLSRIKHPAILALYRSWKSLRTDKALPSVESLRLEQCAAPGNVFVAELVDLAPFTLKRTFIGAALTAQLGGGQKDGLQSGLVHADSDEMLHSLEAMYRRCLRLQEPSLDSLRLGGDQPLFFERLLLPCATADKSANYLVGMVMFETSPPHTNKPE
jgi:hypothetical protein